MPMLLAYRSLHDACPHHFGHPPYTIRAHYPASLGAAAAKGPGMRRGCTEAGGGGGGMTDTPSPTLPLPIIAPSLHCLPAIKPAQDRAARDTDFEWGALRPGLMDSLHPPAAQAPPSSLPTCMCTPAPLYAQHSHPGVEGGPARWMHDGGTPIRPGPSLAPRWVLSTHLPNPASRLQIRLASPSPPSPHPPVALATTQQQPCLAAARARPPARRP